MLKYLYNLFRLMAFCGICAGCVRTPMQLEKTRIEHMEEDQAFLYRLVEEKKDYKLTLQDAINLALENNLDIRVKAQALAVQEETMWHTRWFMLPVLEESALRSWRNKNTAANGKLLPPPPPPPTPVPFEISSDQLVVVNDIELSWNLLDFGVSYYRSRQEADKTLIAFFDYKRTRQNVILDVTRAFWKLAALNKGFGDAANWLIHADEVVARVQHYVDEGLMSPIQAASFNSQVLDNKVKIEIFGPEQLRARAAFYNLVGLPPEANVELVGVDFTPQKIELPTVAELEELALFNRPELYGNDLAGRISADDVRIALIQIFPALTPFIRQSYDHNSFLLFHHWYTVGLRMATNLLAIPEKIQLMIEDQAQKDLVKQQRLVLSLGILTQVNLAYALYQEQFKFYRTYDQIYRNTDFVRRAAEKLREYSYKGDMDIIMAQGLAYYEQINALNTYAEYAASLEQLNNAIGLPGYLESLSSHPDSAPTPCPTDEGTLS